MFVKIAAIDGSVRVTVEEPDDCTRLHIVGPADMDDAAVARLLIEEGKAIEEGKGVEVDGGRVALSVAWLRDAARSTDVVWDWDDRFATMLAYARRMGWADDAGTRLAAHIER